MRNGPLYIIAALTVLVGAPVSSQALELERGPYIQMVTQTSATIRWRTDLADDSELCYHTVLGSVATQCSNNAGPGTEHEVDLAGLTANTKYFYSVGETDGPTVLAGPDADHYFWTQPAVDDTGNHRIWFFSDNHSHAGNGNTMEGFDNSIAGMQSFTLGNPPDLMIAGGDNAGTTGTDAEYTAQFFTPLTSVMRSVPLFAAMGNHECVDGDDNTAVHLANFTFPTAAEIGGGASGSEQFYSFDYGNIHVIILDLFCSDRTVTTSAQWIWLDADLAANDQEWTIVVDHYAPYTDGKHPSDSQMTVMHTDYVPLLESYGVDLVLSGHSHSYERSMFIDGHHGDSSTFDETTMAIDTGLGGCCKGSPYKKLGGGPVANSGAVYAVVGGTTTNSEDGTWEHPVMVATQNSGGVAQYSPPGNEDQGTLIIDVQDKLMDVHWVHWTGRARDHFQIQKTTP